MAELPVGAVGDNLRCFQSVFMFVSSANVCFRVGDLLMSLLIRMRHTHGPMIFSLLLMEAILRPVQYTLHPQYNLQLLIS